MSPFKLKSWRRLWRREDGSATIEFALLFPVFVVLLVTGVEMSVLTLRQVMLERGMDLTVRKLRIGSMDNPSFEAVKADVCKNALIIPDCNEVVNLELTEINPDTWDVPNGNAECVNRTSDVKPVVNFTPGLRNGYMLIRACAVFDPFFPNIGLAPDLPLDASGGYRLIASSSFVNEP